MSFVTTIANGRNATFASLQAGRVHIHVRRAGSFSEQLALLFRDFLRGHQDVAASYGELKMALAQRYTRVEDRHLYTEAKAPLMWNIVARAHA